MNNAVWDFTNLDRLQIIWTGGIRTCHNSNKLLASAWLSLCSTTIATGAGSSHDNHAWLRFHPYGCGATPTVISPGRCCEGILGSCRSHGNHSFTSLYTHWITTTAATSPLLERRVYNRDAHIYYLTKYQ